VPDASGDWIVDLAPVGIARVDADGRLVGVNPALAGLLGETPEPGAPWTELLHPDDRSHVVRPAPGDRTRRRVRLRPSATTKGLVVLLLVTASDGSGVAFVEPERRTATVADLPVEGSDELRRLRELGDVVVLCAADGSVLAQYGNYTPPLGWRSADWIGHNIFEFADPQQQEGVTAFSAVLDARGLPITRELRVRTPDGGWAWIHLTGMNLLDDPEIGAVVLVGRNITAQRQAAEIQRSQAEIFELIACGAPVELALIRLSQFVESAVPGGIVTIFLVEDDRLRLGAATRLDADVLELIETGRWHGPVGQCRRDGKMRAVVLDGYDPHELVRLMKDKGIEAVAAYPIHQDGTPETTGVLTLTLASGRLPDETESALLENAARLASIAVQRHRADERMSQLALFDRLTGLPNRAQLLAKLDEGIHQARSLPSTMGVMFLDLDNFKIVNDSLGHAAGDQILLGFADRLNSLVRPGDLVGRFGGDEFVVLLDHVISPDDAASAAERLLEDLRRRPFRIDDSTVFLSVSVGIAVSPNGRDAGEVLLRHADSAMYQAKQRGRSRIEIYDDGLPGRAAARLSLEADLHQALERGEFVLYWQPKVSLATGRIVSAEALLRWDHPERGLLAPDDFVPIAEETELIGRIGGWALEQALEQRARWEAELGADAPWSIAVNVSALQLSAPATTETVMAILQRSDWPPERLVLELTESVLMDEATDAPPALRRLQALGVRIAIDDFGTGYSSLSYLHRFPVDYVKLDKAFVTSIEADGEGSPIARAVVNMAHALGIMVTAEGVETEAQVAGLRALHCDWAQGYHFARPMPADEFGDLLRRSPRFELPSAGRPD